MSLPTNTSHAGQLGCQASVREVVCEPPAALWDTVTVSEKYLRSLGLGVLDAMGWSGQALPGRTRGLRILLIVLWYPALGYLMIPEASSGQESYSVPFVAVDLPYSHTSDLYVL